MTPQPRFLTISNPTPGGSARISRKNAERAVSRGKARWVGASAIEYLRDVQESNTAHNTQRRSETGYDGIKRPLSSRELRRLPMVGDVSKLL